MHVVISGERVSYEKASTKIHLGSYAKPTSAEGNQKRFSSTAPFARVSIAGSRARIVSVRYSAPNARPTSGDLSGRASDRPSYRARRPGHPASAREFISEAVVIRAPEC